MLAGEVDAASAPSRQPLNDRRRPHPRPAPRRPRDAQMPGLAAVIIGSIAHRHWREHDRVLVDPGAGAAADCRASRTRAPALIEPRGETGSYPGMSWPEYRDLASDCARFDGPSRVSDGAAQDRRGGRVERVDRPARVGQLFLRRSACARARTLPQRRRGAARRPRRSWSCRTTLAVALRRRRRRRADPSGERSACTIVGVAPQGFQGTVMGLTFDLWVPATLAPVLPGSRELESRGQRGYMAIGRSRRGASRAQAQAELDAAMSRWRRRIPTPTRRCGERCSVLAVAARPAAVDGQALAMLQGVMLLVLLAVCGNTANLVLARASARRQEVGDAPGARRRPLADRQPDAHGDIAARGRSARRSAPRSRSGAPTRCARCRCRVRGIRVLVPDARRSVSLAFAMALGLVSGLALRLAAGAASGADSTRSRRSRGRAARRRAAACATR